MEVRHSLLYYELLVLLSQTPSRSEVTDALFNSSLALVGPRLKMLAVNCNLNEIIIEIP